MVLAIPLVAASLGLEEHDAARNAVRCPIFAGCHCYQRRGREQNADLCKCPGHGVYCYLLLSLLLLWLVVFGRKGGDKLSIACIWTAGGSILGRKKMENIFRLKRIGKRVVFLFYNVCLFAPFPSHQHTKMFEDMWKSNIRHSRASGPKLHLAAQLTNLLVFLKKELEVADSWRVKISFMKSPALISFQISFFSPRILVIYCLSLPPRCLCRASCSHQPCFF
ncbi:hypothetical protein BX070DRAFT_257569 [Coemansia spiralis]|nr:hypothetical protein BX070DRAFT_257569 [Coemansia spiralis]